jgi:hypothetical protein
LLREAKKVRFVRKIACLLLRDNWWTCAENIIDFNDIRYKSWRLNRIR